MGSCVSGRHAALVVAILVTSVAAQWSAALSLSLAAGSISAPGGVASGLKVWADSAEIATLGLAPRVRFWFDKSGDGRHLSALPVGTAPYATAVSLRQQIIFEDNALALGQPLALNSMTAFFVIRGGSDTGYHPLLGKLDRATGIIFDAKRVRASNGGGSVLSGIIGSINSNAILMIRMDSAGTDYASINGGTEYSFSFSSSESATHVGAIYSSTATRYLRASISEIAIWDRVLTAAERTSVSRALGTKWGITVP